MFIVPLFQPVRLRLLVALLLISAGLRAQPDSVIVSGRINHLTPRLYRQSPTVLVTTTNILQASQELAHPAPLQPDGSFRVAVPLIYPQEEMYVTAVGIGTAFLAAAGAITIDIDADSLFVAAVPFRFGGVNAQVNQQFAAYKAYDARNKTKIDAPTLTRRIAGLDDQRAFAVLTQTFDRTLRDFSATRPVFPLLTRWLTSIARYDAASFLYDRATETEQQIRSAMSDSLRPPADRLLTASRATAMSRFSMYASQRIGVTPDRSIPIKNLVSLLSQYGRNLSEQDQSRLEAIRQKGGATNSDMRFLNAQLERDGGIIRRLLLFDISMKQARMEFDSATVDYIEASSLVGAMNQVPIASLPLMFRHIRPLVGDLFIGRSLDDAYARQTKDSVAIRQARSRLMADSTHGSVEVATGIFVTRNRLTVNASQLINQVVRNNPGRAIYVLRWQPGDPQSQALVTASQRLRDDFDGRDLTLLYINEPDGDPAVWLESIIRQNIKGEHLFLTNSQWGGDLSPLPPYDAPAYVLGTNGKAYRKNAESPTDYEKLVNQIRQVLAK